LRGGDQADDALRGSEDARAAKRLVLHGTRTMLMRQPIQLSNVIRGHMAEFGVVAPVGRDGLLTLIDTLHEDTDDRLPAEARHCLQMLAAQLRLVNAQILENDRRIRVSARATDVVSPEERATVRAAALCEGGAAVSSAT